MFRTCTLLSFLTVFAITFGWLTFLAYGPLHSSGALALLPSLSTPSGGHQLRREVRKDLFVVDAKTKTRLHSRIESDLSLLELTQKGASSFEVVEHLNHLHGLMQEKIDVEKGKTFQQVRAFTSKEGLYLYKEQCLRTKDTLLSLYKTPGRDLPWDMTKFSPFLQGSAQKIHLTFEKGSPSFRAEAFKASSQGGTP